MAEKQKPQRKPLNAETTIKQVTTDEDFGPEVQRHDGNVRAAFGTHALTLVNMLTNEESGYRPRMADQLHVAATLEAFVAGKSDLDGGQLHPSEIRPTKKERVIPFNHALKRLIDNDPGANFNEVANYLNTLYRTTHPRESDDRKQYADQKFREVLKGMVNEIVAEQLAGWLGYEVDSDVTVDEETRGIDSKIEIDGVWRAVDFKSSKTAADKFRATDTRGHLYLATNIPNEVIGCNFRLPSADVPKYAKLFQAEIDRELVRVEELKEANRVARSREYGIPA